MTEESNNKSRNTLDLVKRLAGLYIDNIRYTSAEKLTILFSGIAMFSIALVLMIIALIFVFIGLANMLDAYIATFWSYFIIAAIVVIIVAVLLVFRDALIVNPIARFISKLFIDAPKK